MACPVTAMSEHFGIDLSTPASSEHQEKERAAGPSFWEAVWGIGVSGSPWEYMLRMKEQGYDGVVPVDLGIGGKYHFLLSPATVKAATVTEARLMPRRFSVPLFATLELDRGIVYEQGGRHKKHKKACLPSFEQAQSMDSFIRATRTELSDMSQSFAEKDSVDLYAEMRRSALNVVLAVTFGLGSEAAADFAKADELSRVIGEYLERIVALANEIPPLWQISPRLSYNYVRVTDVLLPNLRELVGEVIAARRALAAAGDGATGEGGDLLGVLVERPDLTDADIRSILFDVVIAGSDTTASTTTAALYVLHQPENAYWLARAREEALACAEDTETGVAQLRASMPVITGVAKEILRLYPAVPFVGRTATRDGALSGADAGPFPVAAGDTYCFSPWCLGRDPGTWGAGAATFDPGRWVARPADGGADPYAWLPFGAGPRGCLGTRLGLTEVVLGIARLLADFDFAFARTGLLPVRYDLTLNLDGVMECQIKPRG